MKLCLLNYYAQFKAILYLCTLKHNEAILLVYEWRAKQLRDGKMAKK